MSRRDDRPADGPDRRRDGDRSPVLGINRRNLDLVFADYRPGQFRELDDKVQGKARLERAGVAVPQTVGVVRDGRDLERLDGWLDGRDEVVIKPARGWGGRGILVLARDGADAWRTPGGRRLDQDAVRLHVEEVLTGAFSLDESQDQAILEERIHAHPFLEELYPRGLSDLRVVLEDGEPIQAMLRVPTDASDGKANLHGGGLGLGIDLASGRVVRAVQHDRDVAAHPDTGLTLVGREIPDWPACLQVARDAAAAVAPIRYLGVDIVLDAARGPLVLEVNARPGLAIQIANQQGQPVRRRTRFSRLDRWTQWASWLVLGLLVLAPWGFGVWQEQDLPEVRAVRAEQWDPDATGTTDEDAATVEWVDQATPVSERSEQFARARAAAAAGDTAGAIALYRTAARDSTLTPFALNNLALIQRSRGELLAARATLERAVVQYPEYQRGIYNLGLIRRDLGDHAAAEASFRASLALEPGHARSWSELGELLLARGEADSARQALEQAIRFNPDAIGDRRRLGRALMLLDRPGEAAARFAQALALAPGSASAAEGWVDARLQHAARDGVTPPVASLDSLQAALRGHGSVTARALAAELDWWAGQPLSAFESLAALPLDELDTRWLVERTALALELGLWGGAQAGVEVSESERLVRLREALALGRALEAGQDPGEGEALEDPRAAAGPPADGLLALALALARGQPMAAIAARIPDAEIAAVDAAERAYVAAVRLASDPQGPGGAAPDWAAAAGPTAPRLRRSHHRVTVPLPAPLLLAAAHRWPAARQVLAARYPDFRPQLRADFLAAVAAADTAGPAADLASETARRLGERLLRTAPDAADVLLAMIRLELAAGELAAARDHLEDLAAADRGRPDARRLEGRLLLAEGEVAAARRILADLAADSPRDADAWRLLATAQARDARLAAAAGSWQRALQLAPDDVPVREQRARALMELDRYGEAADEWRRLLRLDLEPDLERSALFNLALALQRDDRVAAALATWDRLLERAPDMRTASYNRALALERLGRRAEAMDAFTRVLELDPDHEPSQRRLERLRSEGEP